MPEDSYILALPADLAAALGAPEVRVFYYELDGGVLVNGVHRVAGGEIVTTVGQRLQVADIVTEQLREARSTYGTARHSMGKARDASRNVVNWRPASKHYRPGSRA